MPPRRANSGGSVRGPASALTSFLAGLGVEPPSRLTTWGDTSALNAVGPDGQPIVDPAGVVTERNVEAGPSQVGEGDPSLVRQRSEEDTTPGRPRKRARAASVDSDDLDAEVAGNAASENGLVNVRRQPLRAIGEFMDCGECGKQFSVTAYTKEHPKHPQLWLDIECTYALEMDPFEKPKKPKAKPVRKEDRGKVVHYETRRGAASLSDICIKLIGTYIEDVEQLGDIGSVNMDKVCKIIAKSRKLTPATASLFYSVDRTELKMYDCTNLVQDSYMAMANLCPNLESLYLHLCGQITTDTLIYWGTTLPKLRHLELFAPFLVRKNGWISFFESVGARLESFMITQSPRIDLETIEVMVRHCPNIAHLRLAEVGQMSDVLLGPIAQLKNLISLDISSPGSPLSENAIYDLIEAVGSKLERLTLSDITPAEGILPGIAKYCPNLRSLSLNNLDMAEKDVAAFFNHLSSMKRPGLQWLEIEKGDHLQGKALQKIIAHSGKTLEHLSIMGWKGVENEALQELRACDKLGWLNIGWCREVTDMTMKDILEGCESVKEIRVWGCNQLTDAVPRKRGVKVIGIETHAI